MDGQGMVGGIKIQNRPMESSPQTLGMEIFFHVSFLILSKARIHALHAEEMEQLKQIHEKEIEKLKKIHAEELQKADEESGEKA